MSKKASAASKLMDDIDALEAEELRLEERLLARRGGSAEADDEDGVAAAAWAWWAADSVGAAARLVPLGAAAAAGALGWALVSCCCDVRCGRDERRLAGVYRDARDKARLLRDEVDYDRTLQLLSRMDRPTPRKPAPVSRVSPPTGTEAVVSAVPSAATGETGRCVVVNGHEVLLKRLVCARCHYNNGYLPEQDWNTISLLPS